MKEGRKGFPMEGLMAGEMVTEKAKMRESLMGHGMAHLMAMLRAPWMASRKVAN